MDEEDEILSFRPTKPLKESLAEALRQAKAKTVDVKPKSKKWSKSESDEEERERIKIENQSIVTLVYSTQAFLVLL